MKKKYIHIARGLHVNGTHTSTQVTVCTLFVHVHSLHDIPLYIFAQIYLV